MTLFLFRVARELKKYFRKEFNSDEIIFQESRRLGKIIKFESESQDLLSKIYSITLNIKFF